MNKYIKEIKLKYIDRKKVKPREMVRNRMK